MRLKDTEFKPNYKIIQYGWIGIILLLALGLDKIDKKYPNLKKYL